MSAASLSGAHERSVTFPPVGDGAFLIGMTFLRLGGSFSISSKGQRLTGRPFGTFGAAIPQLPQAEPHEQFHNEKEWRGALKLLSIMLDRLDSADRDLIFDALATTAVDERSFVPSIEEPTRRAA